MKINISNKSKILIFDNYENHIALKDEIVNYLESYPDIQNRSTNVQATMTEWDISSPQIEVLKNYVLSNCSSFAWEGIRVNITHFWANIYRKNDYTVSHDHLPYFLSFVYFLKSKSYYSSLYFETTFGKRKIIPKEGRMVIFPSYLIHGVNKHVYNDTRITLAGNIATNDIL